MNKKILIAGIAVFLACLVLIPSVSADWLSGWDYRKVINVTGQSGAGTHYQVNLSIGNTLGGDFHLEGHCTDFPNDTIVTDNDGTTKIPFWIENTSADPIQIRINVSDNLNTSQDVFVYYGKSGESSASNGTNTFIAYHGTASAEFHDTNLSIPPFIYEAKVRRTSDSAYILWGLGETGELDAAPGDAISVMTYHGNNRFMKSWNDGVQDSPNDTPQFTLNQWYKVKITIANASSAILWTEGYGSDLSATTNVPDEIMGLAMQFTSGTGEQDWSFTRKYNSPEPVFSSAGSEESADCTTPTISDLTNSTAGTTNVTITWSTNQSADNRVKYSKNSDLSNEEWSSWDNDTTSISIDLTSLDTNTLYYYQAWSYNGINATCYITEPISQPYKNFTTQKEFCTTPTITDLTNSTPGTTSTTITWSTNQSADSRVKYSKNSDLSNEEWSNWHNDTSSISIGLSSLDSGTLYFYQAWSYNGTNSSCYITEPVSSPYKNFTTQSVGIWTKKAPIHINNTGGPILTYYQIPLNITYDNDMNDDFSDIRVKNETLGMWVPCWNESAVDSSWNKIWFNATNIPGSSWCNNTYYLYYGNSSASSVSNITTTFLFGDDFENTTLIIEDWYLEQQEPYLWRSSSGWDAYDVENPYLYYNESNGLYYLFYEAIASSGSMAYKVGFATSSNATGPFTKSEFNPVIDVVGKEGEPGNSGTNGGSVIKVGNMYYMFVGHDTTGTWDYIQRYNSTDLVNWTNNGTALSPNATGWDSSMASPEVIYDPDTAQYLMVYEGFKMSDWSFQVGLAKATNITDNFTRNVVNPIIDTNVSEGRPYPSTPCIEKNGSMYIVHFDGYVSNSGIFRSTSIDLINWTHNSTAVYRPIGNTPEETFQTCPSIFNDSGTRYLFHSRGNASYNRYEISIAFEGETEIIECNNLSNWITDTGSPTTDSGLGGSFCSLYFPTSSTNDYITSSNFSQEYSSCIIDTSFCVDQHFLELRFGLQSDNLFTGNYWIIQPDVGNSYIKIYDDSYTIVDQVAWSGVLNTEYKLSIVKNSSNITTYINGIKYNDNFDLGADDYNVGKTCLGSYGQGNFDDVRIRKYTTTEPTAQLGTEESVSESTPVISNVSNGSISPTSQWIDWDVNQTTHNRVKYSNESDMTPSWWSNWQNTTNAPNITISGLDASTQYWFTAYSYNIINTSLYDNSSIYNFTTTATDTSFTVTLPVGYTCAHFQPPNSTAKNYSCNGQNLTTAFYNVTNTGNVNLDVRMKLNTTITNIILRADTDNNPSGSSIIQTTLVTIYSSLTQSNSINIWIWSDFNHTTQQTTNKTLSINVTE